MSSLNDRIHKTVLLLNDIVDVPHRGPQDLALQTLKATSDEEVDDLKETLVDRLQSLLDRAKEI